MRLVQELQKRGHLKKVREGLNRVNTYYLQHAPIIESKAQRQNKVGSDKNDSTRSDKNDTVISNSNLNKSQDPIEEKLLKFLRTEDKIRQPEALIRTIKSRYGPKYLPRLMQVEVTQWYDHLDQWKKRDTERLELAKNRL